MNTTQKFVSYYLPLFLVTYSLYMYKQNLNLNNTTHMVLCISQNLADSFLNKLSQDLLCQQQYTGVDLKIMLLHIILNYI